MKSVSYWAKHNMNKARLLIVLCEILLFILAVWLGFLLLQSGVKVPGKAVLVPIIIFSSAVFITLYEKAFKHQNNNGYWRQRLCFFLLGLSMFLLSVFFVSSEKLLTWNTYSSLSGNSSSLLVKPAPSSAERFSARQMERATRLLKKMQKHSSLNWLYVFLIIVGGLSLLTLIAALSCSLSCNGNGAFSLLVLLLGGGGVIFLCVWLIQKILKGKAPEKEQPALATI